MIRGKSEKTYTVVCTIICTLTALLCLYPLVYTLFVSFCTNAEWIKRGGVLWFFPTKPTFTAYAKILGSTTVILKALWISVLRTGIGTILGVAINAMAAYALSRKILPGKKIFIVIMLFTILFSGGLIPTYLTVEATGLKNTIWSMIIPMLFSAWNILVIKQFFEGIPPEIEESGQIDGITEVGSFFYIVIPMSKAVLAAIAMFTMVGHWNSWFDASIYLDPTKTGLWPLQLYTKVNLLNTSGLDQGQLDFMINNQTVSTITMQMALTVVTVLPMLVVYPFFQKYFTKGVYVGSVKG